MMPPRPPQTTRVPLDQRTDLEARVRDLERALAHARAVADEERRRADKAEASARTAWRVAARV